jgi:hypothetical protein
MPDGEDDICPAAPVKNKRRTFKTIFSENQKFRCHSGAPRSGEPGIHIPCAKEGHGDSALMAIQGLWIPGPRFARPGMTAGYVLAGTSPRSPSRDAAHATFQPRRTQ